jgi:hypothetical protein
LPWEPLSFLCHVHEKRNRLKHSPFACLLPLPRSSLMAELFYLSITICYANYSILLFQKQDFSPRCSAIYGLDPIRWRERIGHSPIQAKQPTPSKAPQEKEPAVIHPPLRRSNGSLWQVPNSSVLKVEMGTGTWIHIWSNSARNHPIPG